MKLDDVLNNNNNNGNDDSALAAAFAKASEGIFPTRRGDFAFTGDIGLTKREYFAGLAMQALISKYGTGAEAAEAVEHADSIIAALNVDGGALFEHRMSKYLKD